MAKAIFTYDTTGGKKKRTEWASSTKDGIASRRRIYGDVRVADDENEKRVIYNHTSKAGETSPAVGVHGRRTSNYENMGLRAIANAGSFEEYVKNRKAAEEAEGMRTAAEKLSGAQGRLDSLMEETRMRASLAETAAERARMDAIPGRAMRRDVRLMMDADKAAGGYAAQGEKAETEEERQSRADAQAAAEALMQNYGYKKVGNRAVFATPFSPLSGDVKGKADVPQLFGMEPTEYVSSLQAIDRFNTMAEPETDEETSAFLQKYFPDAKGLPTADEYNAKYEELYNDWSIPDEDVRYFWENGQELLGRAQNAQDEYDREFTEARGRYDAAMELLGPGAEEAAGGSMTDYYTRYGAKLYGQERPEEEPLTYRGYGSMDGMTLEDAKRYTNSPYAVQGRDRYGLQRWSQTTPEERAAYQMMMSMYGEEAAEEYMRQMEPELNKRLAEAQEKESTEWAEKRPLFSSLKTVFTAPVRGAGMLEMAAERLMGKESDPYDPRLSVAREADTIRETVARNSGKVGGFLYQTGMSIVDNLANMAVWGGLGSIATTVSMGAGSAASAYNDAIERGASSDQAMASAALSGIAEAVFESFSLDNVIKMAKGNGLKTVVGNIAKQMGIEGSEELFTGIANEIADRVIMGDISNYALNMDMYMQQGMQENAARRAANKDMAKEIGLGALGGVISGGVMGGGAQALTGGNSRDVEAKLKQAEQPKEKAQESKMQTEPEGKAAPATARAPETPDVRDALMRDYEGENTAAAAQEGQEQAQTPKAGEQQDGKEKPAEGAEKAEKGETLQTSRTASVTDENGTHGVTVLGVKGINDSGMITMEVENQDGTRDVVNAADVSFDDANTEELMGWAAGERMDAKGLRSYLDGYDESIATPEEYAEAFGSVYSRAKAGVDFEEAALENSVRQYMTRDAMIDAYAAGQNAYNQGHDTVAPAVIETAEGEAAEGAQLSARELPKYAKVSRRYTTEGFNRLGTEGKKNALAQMELLGAIASRTKRTITIVDTITGKNGQKANALYDPKTGEIRVALDATGGAYSYAAMHELTHAVKNEHQSEWGGMVDFVRTTLADNGQDWDGLVKYQMDQFGYNREQAEEEVVCNTVPALLQDERNVLKLYNGNRTLFERVVDWVRGLLDDVKAAGEKLSQRSKSWQQMDALKNDRKALQEMYDRLMAVMEKNAETVSENHAVKMSTKDSDKLTKTKYDRFGWIRANDIMSVKAYDALMHKYSDVIKNKYSATKSADGYFLIETGDEFGVNNYVVAMKGSITSPEIVRVYSIDLDNETRIEIPRRSIIENEKKYGRNAYEVIQLDDENGLVGYNDRSHSPDYYQYAEEYAGRDSGSKGRRSFEFDSGLQNGRRSAGKSRTLDEVNFSLKEPVEETRDLLAVHNLTEENMRNAMELGGLAMPSIAVIKAEQGHSKYGPISVVFDKSTIDPNASSANEIYGGDAWTPTFPQVEYEADSKAEERISNKYYELKSKYGNDAVRPLYRYATDLEEELKRNGGVSGIVDRLNDNTDMMQLYLADTGREMIKPVMKQIVERVSTEQQDMNKWIISTLGEDEVRRLGEVPEGMKVGDHNRAWVKENAEEIRNIYSLLMAEKIGDPEAAKQVAESLKAIDLLNIGRNAYKQLNGETERTKEVVDEFATEKAIRAAVDEKAYENWLNELFAGAVKRKGIRNKTDLYTPSGKRRGFSATHWEVTLDNVVRAMRAEEKTGIGTLGRSIEGAAVKKYSSIKDVKADSGRLQTIDQDEYDAMRREFGYRFSEIAYEYADGKDEYDAGDALVEYVTKKQTADGIYQLMQKDAAFYKPSRQVAKDLAELVDEMKNAPTGYFEAKPRRAVGFEEMAAVVVPDSLSEDVKKQLEDRGVNLIEYEAGNEADRLEKMNGEEVSYLRFSMRETDENIQTAFAAEENAFMQVKAHRINAMEADKLAGEMLRTANSDYDRQRLAAEISRTIAFAESGEDVDMQQVDDELTAIAARVMEKSKTLDLEHEERMKPLRDYLRTTPIRLSDYQRSEAANKAGSYGAYRKSLFGRVRLNNTARISLEDAWGELSDMDSALFPKDVNETDMPEMLLQAVDAMKPVYHTGMGMNMEESANWLAGKLTQNYFDLPAVKAAAKDARTFGDSVRDLKKAMRQFEEVSWSEYQNSLQAIKAARNNQQRTQKQEETAALRDKYQKWRAQDTAQRKERETKNRYRGKIERTVMQLTNWMQKPTDAKHIPAGLEDSVRRMLETLDFGGKSTKTARELSDRLDSLADVMLRAQEGEDEGRTFFLERDQQLIDEIKRVAELIRGNTSMQQKEGRGVYDLTGMELRELSKWLDVIRHNVTEASKLRGSDLPYESVDEAANMAMLELRRKKPHKDKKWATKQWNELYGPDMQDSFTFFERLGPTTNTIFRGLREGFDKVVRLTQEAQKHTETVLEGLNLKELTGRKAKKQTFELASGTVEMTRAQVMELYVLNKREQARGHLYGEGIRIQGSEDARAHAITKGEVKRITDTLTAKEKRAADGMQQFLSRECAGWGNEASMKLVGYRKFGEENYWPIRTDSNTRNTTRLEENYAADINAIKNQGMTKATIEGAKNAIVVGDIFDTYTRHISNMAAYAGYAVPLSDFSRFYNSRGVKTEIEQAYGRKGLAYINQFLMAVNGSALREEQSGLSRVAGKMTRNAKIASVGLNARVVVQQPTSYARAAMYMSPKYLGKALAMKAPDQELVNKWCGIAQWKRWGFYETNIGPNLRQMIVGDETLADKAREIAMKPAAWGDEWTLNRLWNACELETREMYGYKVGSDEYYRQVGRRMSELIDRTQVVDSVFHRSQMMRSKNAMAQMLTNFMSEPTKTYNMLMSAISDYADNRKNKAAKNRVVRAFAVHGATALMTAAAAAVVDAVRDDDADKEWAQKYLDAAKSNAKDNLSPFGLLPGVSDVLSLLEGYEPSRLDTQSIQRLIWAAQEIRKYAEGTSKQSLYGVSYKVAQALSSIAGLPVSNVMRDANALIQTVTGETPTLNAKARSGQTVAHLYEAIKKGDKKRAEELRGKLTAKAKMTPKEIDTELAERLMTDPKVQEAWEAKQARRMGDFNRARNDLTVKGFGIETVDKAIQKYGSSVTPKKTREKDMTEQLNVKLFTSTDAADTVRMAINGQATEADLREILSELTADSEAKEPEKSVRSSVQSALKQDYMAMVQKGDPKARKLERILKEVLGTPENTIEKWRKEANKK